MSREHSPISGTYPSARKDLSIGFTGTYWDDGAEFEANGTGWQAILSIQICLPVAIRGLKELQPGSLYMCACFVPRDADPRQHGGPSCATTSLVHAKRRALCLRD